MQSLAKYHAHFLAPFMYQATIPIKWIPYWFDLTRSVLGECTSKRLSPGNKGRVSTGFIETSQGFHRYAHTKINLRPFWVALRGVVSRTPIHAFFHCVRGLIKQPIHAYRRGIASRCSPLRNSPTRPLRRKPSFQSKLSWSTCRILYLARRWW